jgi:branched-chain amino acid transport system substrate-binding protein
MAIRGDVDRAGIPEVALSAGSVVTNPIDELVFSTPWPNTLVLPYLCKYLQSQNVTKIAMTDTGGFGKDGLAVLQSEAPKYGITIVTSQTFNPGDTDFSPQLTNIKKSDAQAMVLINAGKDAAAVVKQANEIDLGIPIYGTHGNARKDFITGAGAGAEGFKFPAGKVLVPETYGTGTDAYTVATDFIERFTAATGNPPDTFAGHAYDAFNIVVEAATRAGDDVTPQTLRDQIEQTKDFVGIGGTFNYSATDHNGMTENDLVMYEIKDGKWVVVSQ